MARCKNCKEEVEENELIDDLCIECYSLSLTPSVIPAKKGGSDKDCYEQMINNKFCFL